MTPGEEIAVDIETGKTLVIRCLAIGETDEEGIVRVFFELNGQPRVVKVPDRAIAADIVRPPQGRGRQPEARGGADAGRRRLGRGRRRPGGAGPATCCCPSRR